MAWGPLVLIFLILLVRRQAELAAEILVLRQQLAILKEKVKLPRLRPRDRVFWVWLSKLWSSWRSALLIAFALRWRFCGSTPVLQTR